MSVEGKKFLNSLVFEKEIKIRHKGKHEDGTVIAQAEYEKIDIGKEVVKAGFAEKCTSPGNTKGAEERKADGMQNQHRKIEVSVPLRVNRSARALYSIPRRRCDQVAASTRTQNFTGNSVFAPKEKMLASTSVPDTRLAQIRPDQKLSEDNEVLRRENINLLQTQKELELKVQQLKRELQGEMALEEDVAEDNTSSPAASNTRVPQATATDAAEDLQCPICLDTISNQGSMACCRHIFCFSCIFNWARVRPVCPICQEPFHHIYRKVGPSNYEVYHIVQENSSASRAARRRRSRPRPAERRRRHSSGRQRRSSSSRGRGSGQAGASDRGRSGTPRRHRGGHSRAEHDPSSTGRRQQSRAQDTARDEGRAPRAERDAPASSRRGERRQRGGRDSSRDRQATRSRSQRRSRSNRHQTQREPQTRRDQRQATRSRSQRRSRSTRHQTQREPQRRRDQRQATRSRSQRRSRSTRRRTQPGHKRRRDRDEGRALSPERRVSASPSRSDRRQRGGRLPFSERRATRSRSRAEVPQLKI